MKPNSRAKASPKSVTRVGQQRGVSCRVVLSEAEIDHIIDELGDNTRGKYHGPTDSWTYQGEITGKLQRAKRKAANDGLEPSGGKTK